MRQISSKPKTGFFSGLDRLLHSVRFKLSSWYVLILALVLLVFGAVIYSVAATSLSAEIDYELKFVAEQFPLVTAGQTEFVLPQQVTGILQSLTERKLPENVLDQLQATPAIRKLLEGQYILVMLDGQGKVTQSFGTLNPEGLARLLEQVNAGKKEAGSQVFSTGSGKDSEDYRVYVNPVERANGPTGTVILGLQWEGAATLRGLLLTLLLAGPAILLLAAGGGYWLSGRAFRPVSAITRTAQEISETDLSRRLNISRRDEIGELAATFDHMLGRLEAAFDRQRQFTADASHELRTPLTIVNLEVNRALSRTRKPEEYVRALEVINTENEYMASLVNDLLFLARADAGREVFKPEKLDLSDLALEVLERLAPLARQNGISLSTGDLPELELTGDRLYLTRMLVNLVENAIKYTAGRGDRVRLELGRSEAEGVNPPVIRVKVADNGPGIPAEHLPYLFDRFYQADRSRSPVDGSENQPGGDRRGSGLGLAIVQRVVEAHHGTISVESQPGKGTSFLVRLPVA